MCDVFHTREDGFGGPNGACHIRKLAKELQDEKHSFKAFYHNNDLHFSPDFIGFVTFV